MPVATTRLPQEISDYLSARARITGESVADLLRQAVEQWVEAQDADELVKVQRELNAERERAMGNSSNYRNAYRKALLKNLKRFGRHPPRRALTQ